MSSSSVFSLGILFLILQACSPSIPLETERVVPYPRPYAFNRIEPIQNKNYLVIIDPGHGGDDYGANTQTYPKYYEKNLNLSLARMVKSLLAFQGYEIKMTRYDDKFIALDKRVSYANELGANVFVSLHFNSAPSKEASGIEVFYYRSEQDLERTQNSTELASLILNEVIQNTKAKSRGIKHGNLAVIRNTTMPAVLVEAGFLTNEIEADYIKDPIYLKKIAWGVARGIKEYLDSNSK